MVGRKPPAMAAFFERYTFGVIYLLYDIAAPHECVDCIDGLRNLLCKFQFIALFKFCTDHLAPPLGELSPKATERAVGMINFVPIS